MKIVATVVTYNRRELLKECIQSLLKQDYANFDIYIIDNASTDNTYDFISTLVDNSKVFYFNTGENLGGAGGFNYALKKAAENNYDYVWLMDDDTIPRKESLMEFIKNFETIGEFGFLSSRVEWVNGALCKMNEQKLINESIENVESFSLCRQATFVSLLIPMYVIKDVGLPIKEFFIWGDDVEYTRRISEKYKCYYISKSIVLHKTLNNEGSNIALDDFSRMSRYKYAYRNEVFIAKKEGIKRSFYQISKVVLHLFRILFLSKDNKFKKISIVLLSSVEGLKFSPKIEYVDNK